jgi:hypothetical protein
MKFFTVDVYNSWYSTYKDGSTLEAASHDYDEYLESLKGILTDRLLTLARLPGVDDGLVVEVKHDQNQRTIALTLRCGHVQMGYYDLVLQYEGAKISAHDEQTLAQIARTTRDEVRHQSDLYRHELDLTAAGSIEHRLLFHPGVWFAIRCRALRWDKVDRPDQKLPRVEERFKRDDYNALS